MYKRTFPFILIITLLAILLIFPTYCINASKDSLLLWFNLIIPTLFPFILISYIIINTEIIYYLNRLLSPLFKRHFNLSGSCSIAILIGFLGGYPMGAIITNKLYSNRLISHSEAKFLLSFTNNPSPMFILGFVATLIDQNNGLLLLTTIYLSSIIVGILFKWIYKPTPIKDSNLKTEPLGSVNFQAIDTAILETSKILVKIGGYMILFSIPIFLLQMIIPSNITLYYLISLIELAIGENIIASLPITTTLKLAMIASLTAFGSICVIGQTNSVLTNKDLSIKYYLIPKILATLIAFILTFAFHSFYV